MKALLVRLSVVALFALALTGCDATGPSDTVILNSNSPIPPTVEYTFEYNTDGRQQIGVRSQSADTLGSILRRNGFGRADVVSARVERVVLERVSDPGPSLRTRATPEAKVFSYLTGATVYLGPDVDGVQIARSAIDTGDDPPMTLPLSVTDGDVTDVVTDGSRPAFLMLTAKEDVASRQDEVRVSVDFRIEVQGV